MTLTKANLVETIRDVCEFTKKDSRKLVDELLAIIKDTLVNSEDVLISLVSQVRRLKLIGILQLCHFFFLSTENSSKAIM